MSNNQSFKIVIIKHLYITYHERRKDMEMYCHHENKMTRRKVDEEMDEQIQARELEGQKYRC